MINSISKVNKEQANENRYTQLWHDNYPLRKETIERTFGDCKEQHGLRFTRVRGLVKNEHNVTMIFACHNLKKMANWRWKNYSNKSFFYRFLTKLIDLKNLWQKKRSMLFLTYHFVNSLKFYGYIRKTFIFLQSYAFVRNSGTNLFSFSFLFFR